jgi:hypothetical protein
VVIIATADPFETVVDMVVVVSRAMGNSVEYELVGLLRQLQESDV